MLRQLTSVAAIGGLLLGLAILVFQPATVGAQETVTVPVGDIWFCSADYENGVCATEITQGDTVSWDFSGAALPHTSTACGASCDSPIASPLWDSGIIQGGGGSYQFTFTEPGTYAYYCQVHPYQRGQIVVTAAQQDPTATSDADATPGPGVIPSVDSPPTVGTGPRSGSTNAWWFAAMAGFGLTLVGSGLLFARARVRSR
jgi:hypothetical protein